MGFAATGMNDLSQALAALLVYFAVQPITYTAVAFHDNIIGEDKQCNSFIDSGISSRITEWLIPAVFAAAILFPSSLKGRQYLLSLAALAIALFYASVITTTCPEEWTVTPQTWAFADSVTRNETVIFVPQAVAYQWRASVVFTALSAVLLLVSIQHPKESTWYEFKLRSAPDMHAYLMLLLSGVAAILLLANAPELDKLNASVYCRGGPRHPTKVFDTQNTGFGLLSGRCLDVQASFILVFAFLGLIFRSRITMVGNFVSTGATISMMQYTLHNPGCTTAIDGFDSDLTRAAAVLLVYTWLSTVLCLMPVVEEIYCELKTNF